MMAFPVAGACTVVAITCGAILTTAFISDRATGAGKSGAHAAVVAVANDNRAAAGTWRGDTLVLELVAVHADWYLHDEAEGAFHLSAFAEEGKAPSIPGPLLRVRAGTPVHVIVRNAIADTMQVNGFAARANVPNDSMLIAPGARAETRFVADSVGTFFYWATTSASPVARRGRATAVDGQSQLTGAFIVDPAGDAPIPPDRVFVITGLFDTPENRAIQDSRRLFLRDFQAFNGRSWPHTERLSYQLGASIRWRFINASDAPHSLHLHGFYYQVEALGSNRGVDSVFTKAEPRMAVTEQLPISRTMDIVWVPERPGGWIFHCHMTPHIARHPPIGEPDVVDFPMDHAHGDADEHLTTGMNGLLLATRVDGPRRTSTASRAARTLRLFVHSDSVAGDSLRRFGYVLKRGNGEPRRDSLEAVAPTLIVYRDEPTHIEVVNRSGEATAVHWHGIELESYFDGVVGFGGLPERRTPAIRNNTSFTAQMTPPRAGTFMYHTHFSELRQQFGGLAGALIVLDPGERWDPERDRVFLLSDAPNGSAMINGSMSPDTMHMRVGATYRLRIANITVDRPVARVYLMRDTVAYATWRPVAKDGWPLAGSYATPRDAWQRLGTGETGDFEFTPDAAGDYVFELRAGNAILTTPDRTRPLFVSQVIRVLPER
jgi:FtsP/CotA-like multicopper oxidase with cupredoxin domain